MASRATNILLIRHASADVRNRLCGSFDVPLSSIGRAEVQAIALRAAGTPAPDALVTSTLRRAREVADVLAGAWGLVPRPAQWAREIHCGDVEGFPLDQLQHAYAEHWTRNNAQVDDSFAWPNGETYAAFRARVLQGLRTAAAAQVGGRLVVVTHAGVISQVLGVIRGRPAAAWMPDRPGLLTATEILWQDGAPRRVLRYDDRDWA